MERKAELAAGEVWAALERAAPALVEALAYRGVVGVRYLLGFVHPFSLHVCLVTATDAERDSLGSSNPFLAEVESVILANGFPVEHASINGSYTQSQETVDRDYKGNWFYALR